MTDTNERFDKLWKNLDKLFFAYVGANKESKEKVKTFISQEKNLLLDQAISKLKGMKTCDEVECFKDHDCNFARIQDEALSQAITKLEELKQ